MIYINGRISIDGYLIPNGFEINIHGEQPDPKALVNISMKIHNNRSVKLILEQALKYVDNCIGVEPEEKRFIVLNGGK